MDSAAENIRRHFEEHGVATDGVDFERLAELQSDEARRVQGWAAPRVLPADWREIERGEDGGSKYVNAARSLAAILSCSIEADGRAWLHLSVSHRERIPTHGEMRSVKELFLGDRYAYAVWPPRARYVNLHPFVLHLFALEDADAGQPLPDFTRDTGSL